MNRIVTIGAALAAIGSVALPASATVTFRHNNIPTYGSSPVVTGANGRQYFPFIPAALQKLGVRYVGPASVRKPITFHVETAMRNAAGLKAYATAANTPSSVYYRHWISPVAIAENFGTPAAQYNATAAFFRSYGMIVGTWPMRTSLTVTGTQKQIETALQTKLGDVHFAREAVLRGIASAVGSVQRLDQFDRRHHERADVSHGLRSGRTCGSGQRRFF